MSRNGVNIQASLQYGLKPGEEDAAIREKEGVELWKRVEMVVVQVGGVRYAMEKKAGKVRRRRKGAGPYWLCVLRVSGLCVRVQ